MVIEYSYGIIPLRKQGDAWMVLLIQHSAAGYWGFPKGHPDEGELPKATATRELKEETNLDVNHFLTDMMIEERYHFTFRGKSIDKTVGYLIAEVSGELVLQHQEVSAGKWVRLDEAEAELTYNSCKAVLNSAMSMISR
ncbi:MAG: NUDIX domain-containing protein [Parachlamydiaceae bacterium]|nr:NUDIX domain-containing protein [Parachlamydiaceae bacterium]